ncbi:MAG: PilZ domain-containing protein [Erythrobacter sp.]
MNEFRNIDCQSGDGAVEYKYRGNSFTARMGDMSSEGCKLTVSGSVPGVGEPLDLTLMEDLVVSGKARWVIANVVGVEFDRPVIDAVVRFFGLPSALPTASDVTTDNFGRPLPPLGQEGARR